MSQRHLEATLRGHDCSISALEIFYLPTRASFVKDGESVPILMPTLLSADDSGLVIWWDLNTRRPLFSWQAHSGTVLTLAQIGINWQCDSESNFDFPAIDENFGSVLTHGKDGELRIWKLIKLSDENSFSYNVKISRKIFNGDIEKEFEMPINVMNFSNVSFRDGILITPATNNAEGFDIYKIDLKEAEKFNQLKRLVHDYQPILSPNDESTDNKRGGHGIIMRLSFIDSNNFIAAYESGAIISYYLNKESISITEKFINSSLTPHSVTSLSVDRENVYAASTSNYINIINLENGSNEIFDTKHKGASSLAHSNINNLLIVNTWDGYTRIYQTNSIPFKILTKWRKTMPSALSQTQTQKSMFSVFSKNQLVDRNQLDYKNGRYKNIVRRNREEPIFKNYFMVAYQDGKIGLYTY